jgi:hypothetical protein
MVSGSILVSTQSESAYLKATKQQNKGNKMTFTALHLVTKLNKGTSRTEYGGLNHWGFKAPNGLIRARVFPDANDDGEHLIEVKYYDQSNLTNSYRRRLDWDNATHVCSSYIKVADADKGPDAKTMIAEVNALVEVYNDQSAKHVGRKVVRTAEFRAQDQYNGNDDRLHPYTIAGVDLKFDSNMVLSVTLITERVGYGSGSKYHLDQIEDFAADAGHAAVKEQIAEYRRRIEISKTYLDNLESAIEAGIPIPNPTYHDKKLGVLDNNGVGILIKAINDLIPEPATV